MTFVPLRTEGTRFPPVSFSADLGRILGLPKRSLDPTKLPPETSLLEGYLRRTDSKACVCPSQGRPCPTHLLPVQAHALVEAAKCGGLLGCIGAGHGKTLIDLLLPLVMPGCKVAVLVVSSSLKSQLLDRDWPYYGGHWRLPNLAGGQWFKAGLPVLHVLTYDQISRQAGTDLLDRINPDLFIGDELHNIRQRRGAPTSRWTRYERFFEKHPKTRLCGLSGTFTAKAIGDAAPHGTFALKAASPYPEKFHVAAEWSLALDPLDENAPPGALERLDHEPGDNVRTAFRRRRNATAGVVATTEVPVDIPIAIRIRPLSLPDEIAGYIAKAHEGERPDGEQSQEQLQASMWAWQLCAGFFHRWRYPWGEPPALIDEWFEKRQAWNREVREFLKRPRPHLDSPGLLLWAAYRAHQDPPYEGTKPKWRSATFPEWRAIHKQVRPVQDTVWLSDFMVEDAAAWARESPGIVWVEFPELGARIAKAAGIPYYGKGEEASKTIGDEVGKRSIVASIRAHGTGKNLQVFNRNLLATPIAGADTLEQLLARTHRPNQVATSITLDVYQHTDDYISRFEKARERARFIEDVEGSPQRMNLASYGPGFAAPPK